MTTQNKIIVGGIDITDMPLDVQQQVKAKFGIREPRQKQAVIYCRDFDTYYKRNLWEAILLHTSPELHTPETWATHLSKCREQYRSRLKKNTETIEQDDIIFEFGLRKTHITTTKIITSQNTLQPESTNLLLYSGMTLQGTLQAFK